MLNLLPSHIRIPEICLALVDQQTIDSSASFSPVQLDTGIKTRRPYYRVFRAPSTSVFDCSVSTMSNFQGYSPLQTQEPKSYNHEVVQSGESDSAQTGITTYGAYNAFANSSDVSNSINQSWSHSVR